MIYIIILLITIILLLIIYIINIKKNISNINKELKYILDNDTNKLISISTIDKDIINIVRLLNNNLILLRKEKLKYINGNKKIQDVITNISHDIRTPLTSIKGYISLIDKNTLNKKYQGYFSIINKRLDDSIYLINNLLSYNIILDKDIIKENISINKVIEEVLLTYYDLFNNKNISVNINITKKEIVRYIDINVFNRMLDNLFMNAYKYSKNVFNVSLTSKGILTLSNDTILDNIDINKILNRYGTTKYNKANHGIGLSIANSLAHLNKEEMNICIDKNNLIIKIKL